MVEVTARGRIGVLRLLRPPVNAIQLDLVESLSAALDAEIGAADRAGLVVTGLPGVFSAGIDTREVPRYDATKRAALLRAVNRMVLALYGLERPVVAAISGHALAGGLMIALACDVRLAAAGDFRLGLTEVDAGIPFPAGPLAVLRAEASPETVRRLALGGIVGGPSSPLLAGVVDRVVAPERLLDEAVQAAEQLAAKPGYAAVKRQLRAPTIERLRAIVANDEEPLLERWI